MVPEWYYVYDVYSTLIGVGNDLSPEPDLAVSWKNATPTLWEFRIVKNAHWVDPTKCTRDAAGHSVCDPALMQDVTGADVAFTYNYYVTNANAMSGFKDYVMYVQNASVDPLDPYHVFIQFKIPYAPAIDTFEAMVVIPQYLWASRSVAYANDLPIGSGPYMVDPSKNLKEPPLYIDRNPLWHGKESLGRQVFPDTIRYESYTTTADMSLDLALGKLDVILSPEPAEWLYYLSTKPGIMRQSVSGGFLGELAVSVMTDEQRAWNPTRFSTGGAHSNPLLMDPTIRFAIHMATDRQKMIDKALLGLGTKGDTLVPPANPYAYDYPDYTGGWPAAKPDMNPATVEEEFPSGTPEALQQARDLLNAAGWQFDCATGLAASPDTVPLCKSSTGQPGGAMVDKLEFRFYTLSTAPWWKVAAESVVADTAKIGVKLNLQLYSVNQMNNQIWWSQDYDLWLWDWVFGLNADPSTGYLSVETCDQLINGINNDNGYCPRDANGKWVYDELYNTSLTEMDRVKRKQITDQLNRMIYEYASYNLPFWRTSIYAMNELRWTNWGDWGANPGLPPDVGNAPLMGQQVNIVGQRPPQVPELPPFAGVKDQLSQFSVVAMDPEGLPLTYRWDFDTSTEPKTGAIGSINNDGITDNDDQGSGPMPTFVYNTAKSYGVAVRVSEDSAAGGEWFTVRKSTIKVDTPIIGNPKISGLPFSPVDPVDTDALVTFVPSVADPNGLSMTFTWNFGDGSPNVVTTDLQVTHHYAAGTYTAQMTAQNSQGRSSTASTLVQVKANVAPSVSAMEPAYLDIGATGTFVSFASDQNARDILSYSWTFGDGATGTGNPVTHAYSSGGVYTLTVTVTDSPGGHSVSQSTTVNVVTDRNQAPNINSFVFDPAAPNTGQVVTFTANVSDPDGNGMNWTFDWGDGTPVLQFNTSSTTPGRFVVETKEHVYQTSGRFTAELRISDIPPAPKTPKNAKRTATVTVAQNYAPTVNSLVITPPTGWTTDTFLFSGTMGDADGDSLSWSLNFGDMSPPLTGTGLTVSTSHAYAGPNDYLVTLTVNDGKGHTTSSSTILSVVLPATVDVTFSAPWSQLYVGQTMDLMSFAKALGSPVPAAAVTAIASTGGSITPASGSTDAAGSWKTVVKPLAGSAGTTFTVTVTVNKAPYSTAVGTFPVYVVPAPLSANSAATSKTTEMMSYETARIAVRITDSGSAVGLAGAILTPSTRSGGSFTPVQDLGGGDYAFGWAAPKVTGVSTATIAVTGKLGGYTVKTASLSFRVDANRTDVVNLTQLYVFGVPSSTTLRSGQSITLTVYVYTVEGYAVTGANVVGSLRFPSQGTITKSVDKLNGVYTFTYTAATFASPTLVTIKIDAQKYGYRLGTTRVSVTVSP